jgi:hypothetical protein
VSRDVSKRCGVCAHACVRLSVRVPRAASTCAFGVVVVVVKVMGGGGGG